MKKLFLAIVALLQICSTYAQPTRQRSPNTGSPTISASYQNLEKYWYYRYRLVNDFMKIGTEPGNSIPARNRRLAAPLTSDPNTGRSGMLHYGDATIDLGNYMQVLALEYSLAENKADNGKYRTKDEIDLALAAYQRLDDNAEWYMGDIDNRYPSANATIGTTNRNGFFMRDDVPWLNYVSDNWKHFNRPGLTANPVNTVDLVGTKDEGAKGGASAFAQRYKGGALNNTWLAPAFVSDPTIPRYPVEESQDHLTEIFKGLGLIRKYVPNTSSSADPALYNLLNHMSSNGGWVIRNPLTGRCVYGIAPHTYHSFPFGSCFDAGAWFLPNAVGAKRALYLLTGQQINFSVDGEHTAYQAMQTITSKDKNFAVHFAVFADNWTRPYPWPANNNNTFARIVGISRAHYFQYPHLPLMYKLLRPSNGSDYIGWCPGCDDEDCYDRPEYTDLLNAAPPCGPYNHIEVNWDHGGLEWSSSDRLIEPQARHGFCSHDHRDNADYVGLDYMLLFNLYALVQKDYLTTYFNGYYAKDYSIDYPETVSGSTRQIGTHHTPLEFNFLEYASFINHIGSGGEVIFRGAKKLELMPGFDTEYGATTTFYIKDYACGGVTRDEPYHYSRVGVSRPSAVPGGEEIMDFEVIEYGDEHIPIVDSITYETDTTLYPEDDSVLLDSFYQYVINSGDSDLIHMWSSYFDTTGNSGGSGNKFARNNDNSFSNNQIAKVNKDNNGGKTISTEQGWISIYPNPNDGNFNIRFQKPDDYDIRVLNPLGITVHQQRVMNSIQVKLELDRKLPGGNYTIQILTRNNRYISNITIVR